MSDAKAASPSVANFIEINNAEQIDEFNKTLTAAKNAVLFFSAGERVLRAANLAQNSLRSQSIVA